MPTTDTFHYRNGSLLVEDVAVADLARRFGTPLYVYSRTHMRRQYQALRAAMNACNPQICYSVKANSTQAVIRLFADEGAGFDIVSGGELFRVLRAGGDPARVVFAGVGKTAAEIEYALQQNILFFTVESEPEAARIAESARRLGVQGRIAFRVNPDVDPQTHKFISTGMQENKFGLDIQRIVQACDLAAELPGIEIVGLHLHIGSQILQPQPFAEALRKVVPLCRELRHRHPGFRYLDIGGGLGIDYQPGQQALDLAAYAAAVVPLLRELNLQVVMEPGRAMVGNAGILVTRVEYVKVSHFKRFIIADAAMNDLIRPALYDAYHAIWPVRETGQHVVGDLVGPICESGDFLAQERELPAAGEGDLLAVMGAGAYGFAMASNYNSRCRPAEVMVEGGRFALVRARETWDDLLRGETLFNP